MSEGLSEPVGGAEGEAVAVEAEAPGVVEAETTDVGAAASPWAPTQDDWQALNGRLDALQQQFEPAPQAPQPPSFLQTDEATGEGLIDPAGLQAYIDFQVQQGVNSRLSQYEPVMNQVVGDQGERMVQEKFAELQSTVGAFDTDVARQIAEGIAARTNDPFTAIRQAAEIAHRQQETIKQQAVEEYIRNNAELAARVGNAPREPGAAGAGVQGFEARPGRDGYSDVAANWAARQGIPV